MRPRPTGLPRAFAFDLRAVSIAEGVRAALSVAVIVALNERLAYPPLVEAALAALLTCLCDAGGPLRRRLPALLAFALFGALATAGFGLLRNAPVAVVVPVATFGVFCTSFARIYGQTAMQVGNLLTVVLVLSLRGPLDLDAAGLLGSLFLAGSLWAVLLTMVLWRIYPNRPARRAVADCFRALALLTRDLRAIVIHPDPQETVWDRHAREHRRFVRDSIERARAAVLATARVRGPMTRRATQSWLRLETADQLFNALIAFSELLADATDPRARRAADIMLRRITPVLTLIAQFIVTDAPDRLPRLERAVNLIAAVAGTLPDDSLRHVAEVIVERLRIVITLAATETEVVDAPLGGPAPPRLDRVLGPIRANLDAKSEVLRHAARVAAVAAPAFAFTLTWPGGYEYWLTITLLLTLQPYFALTFTRALERTGGTVVGGIVASGIAVVCTTPIAMAAALFPLTVIALSLRTVSFGLFISCMTPLVILLSELGRPGESEIKIALMRALYTVIGGGLAVAGSYVLWPAWEPGRLLASLRAAIGAHAAYARAEITALLGEAPESSVDPVRRAAGLASNNVEASLQRTLLEPHGADARVQAALTVDAALRRMAGRLSALELDAHHIEHDRGAWHAWRDWIEAAMAALQSGTATVPPRPPLPRNDPDAEALARIARQIELSAGLVGRV